ncbi:MAG: InlB B-repeat-containing protein, partial [Methanocorpusculum sp.]|nr:InlB B-repeat-containing protein [Methanocorpusculum sp.]
TKAGYTFAGWNTQADGGGTDYAEGASIRLDSDITLYAKWDVKYFAEGDGTPANPFRISSVQELQNLSYVVNNSITYNGGNYSESYYNLTENIDLSSVCSAAAGNWTPIGTWTHSSLAQQTPVNGTFDGGNHTISNLYINSPDAKYQGLFGYINSSAVITNVVLYDINISAYGGVGGLAGINNGNIDNCCVSGSLKSIGDNAYAGGLIGQNYGTIENCSASVNVDGRGPPVGGLVGSNSGTITNCYAVGTVSGSNNVGGLVGNNPNGGIITNCYATGFVNGTKCVGGLVGLHGFETAIANSAALNPSVNGTSNVSRLIGFDNSNYQIINSYAWDGMLVNGAKTTTDDKNGTSASSADVWANLTF